MKERGTTLLLAIAALILFYALMAPKPASNDDTVTRPLSSERGPNGYLGAWRWLEKQGVILESLQDRYSELESNHATRSIRGNLLITTMPHRLSLRSAEIGDLDLWVRRGNTLLIMSALADTPEWSMGRQIDTQLVAHTAAISGMKFVIVPAEPAKKGDPPAPATSLNSPLSSPEKKSLIPVGTHPLTRSVAAIAGISEYPASKWRAIPGDANVVLELAQDSASKGGGLWLTQVGEGRIIVCGYGSAFTNKVIGEKDNAQLLANIVARSLGPSGRVLFDDAHQGVVRFYDAGAFFSDARLHRTLYWIVLLWLVFVLGSQHLRTRRASWNPLDVTTFVKTTGDFLNRVLTPARAAQRIFENFFAAARQRKGSVDGLESDWQWLSTQSGISAAQLSELQQLHARAQNNRAVDLTRLHNLINQTLEKLA